MELDRNINYIISGLERSGTSMLMQILNSGDIPTAFNDARLPDQSNPKGYYELEGGKIISRLMEGSFPLNEYKGKFIKITAYGLKFLPPGRYKIIYSERNIEEILDSMEKMIGKEDSSRKKTRDAFIKLNNMVKNHIQDRKDIDVLLINYNDIISNTMDNICKIIDFLGMSNDILDKMMSAVASELYRQRRT